MNELACPYCYWQLGFMDCNVPICFGQKHKPECTHPYEPNACPILTKEAKKHEQRT